MEDELKILKKFDEDTTWMAKNYKELQEKYAGKFIAIINKEIVGVDENAENLINNLKKKLSDEELSRTIIEYIPPKNLILIL
ncbi:MAG: hypothetical protein FE036_03090 [Thermoplasmata archaeon]|nr:MAG: hypothetical protein FE036_03090 [Thermoplasmata archaeon]